jgi:hypothetical protein
LVWVPAAGARVHALVRGLVSAGDSSSAKRPLPTEAALADEPADLTNPNVVPTEPGCPTGPAQSDRQRN